MFLILLLPVINFSTNIITVFFNFIKLMEFYSNPIYVLIILSFMVILSVYAGKSKIGIRLGGPALLVIIFTAIIANLK